MKAEELFKQMHKVVEDASVPEKKTSPKDIKLDAIREWEHQQDETEERRKALAKERHTKTEAHEG